MGDMPVVVELDMAAAQNDDDGDGGGGGDNSDRTLPQTEESSPAPKCCNLKPNLKL